MNPYESPAPIPDPLPRAHIRVAGKGSIWSGLGLLFILGMFPLQAAAGVIAVTPPPRPFWANVLLMGLVLQPLAAVGVWLGHRWGTNLLMLCVLLCLPGFGGALFPIAVLAVIYSRPLRKRLLN